MSDPIVVTDAREFNKLIQEAWLGEYLEGERLTRALSFVYYMTDSNVSIEDFTETARRATQLFNKGF